ncbi:MAG: hypothetical protein V1789_03770 [PVC group bacterium]
MKVYMVVGSEDSLLENNKRTRDALEAAGIPVRLAVCPGLGHAAPPPEEVAKAVDWFMD